MNKAEKQILTAYGNNYVVAFLTLINSEKDDAQEQAIEAGVRAVSYFAQAKAFNNLAELVSILVINTREHRLLSRVINELTTILKQEQISRGKNRWTLRTSLADALCNAGQIKQSLPLYQQSVAEAEVVQNWSDVGWICQNWAVALGRNSQWLQAREIYLRATKAKKKGNCSLPPPLRKNRT